MYLTSESVHLYIATLVHVHVSMYCVGPHLYIVGSICSVQTGQHEPVRKNAGPGWALQLHSWVLASLATPGCMCK